MKISNFINADHLAEIISFNLGTSISTVYLSLLFLFPMTNFRCLFTLDSFSDLIFSIFLSFSMMGLPSKFSEIIFGKFIWCSSSILFFLRLRSFSSGVVSLLMVINSVSRFSDRFNFTSLSKYISRGQFFILFALRRSFSSEGNYDLSNSLFKVPMLLLSRLRKVRVLKSSLGISVSWLFCKSILWILGNSE